MRRAAKFFGVNQKTIARRVPYLAAKAKAEAEAMRLLQGPEALSKDVIYFDELITFEHTRCKPLSVFMAVSQKREILGFSVSSMPPHGRHLRKIALQKYGKRPDLRRKGALACLDQIRPFVGKKTVFKSDQQFFYPALVAKKFPENKHLTFQSKRAVVAGFGELKDKSYDPLFAINHSLAMLRGNLARLARRTWVTTKKAERLTQFLLIYMSMHNVDLLSKAS